MISAAEFTQVVLAFATLVSAVASLLVSVRNHSKLAQVHDLVNSQSHALNELTATSSKAEGVLEEKQRSQRERP
jgi:hypothetical protein